MFRYRELQNTRHIARFIELYSYATKPSESSVYRGLTRVNKVSGAREITTFTLSDPSDFEGCTRPN